MKRIVVEAFEDPSRPRGGHAVILLRDMASMPDRPSIRLRPVEAEVDGDARGLWRGGRLQPIVTRATPDGIELVIGPDVVGNPNLIAGTPVIIEIPDADVRGEFLWPSVAPPAAPRRRRIVVPRSPRRPIAIPAAANDAEKIEEAQASAAKGGSPLIAAAADAEPGREQIAAPAAGIAEKPPAEPASDMTAATVSTTAHQPTTTASGAARPELPQPAADAAQPVQAAPKKPAAAQGEIAWTPDAEDRLGRRPWRRYGFAAAALVLLGFYWQRVHNSVDPDMQLSDRFTRPPITQKADAPAAPPKSSSGSGSGTRDAGSSAATAGAAAVVAKPGAAACTAAEIKTEALAGGRMRVGVSERCKAGEDVHFVYGGADQIARLDSNGAVSFVLDCFGGEGEPLEVRFADGSKHAVPVKALDLERLSKVAVIWRAPVKLDLHAFEYAALPGGSGHVWAGAAGTFEAAQRAAAGERKGRGFLNPASEADTRGDQVEVYTFVHADEQASGSVGLALDYATRGEQPSDEYCAGGKLAEMAYTIVVKGRGTPVRRESGLIAAAPCGAKLGADVRYRQSGLPVLKIKK